MIRSDISPSFQNGKWKMEKGKRKIKEQKRSIFPVPFNWVLNFKKRLFNFRTVKKFFTPPEIASF
ncbi:MAG: hypothetical protein A2W07_03095 [candidate division Zixibacteria bacterium RBG_16_43_9]|nr:MAG: hypothetical protein A2W07_03095 [candidate division Zixibacteria bacterium RBG_16_43_9]